MRRRAVGSVVVAALSSLQMLVAAHRASAQATPDQPGAPSFARTFVGTVTGGVLGAAVAGGTGYLLGSATDGGDDGLSLAEAVVVLAAPAGFWLGQAVGSARGASVPGHSVPTRRTLLPAALWTAAGFAGYGTAMHGWNRRPDAPLSLGLRPSRQGTPVLVARVRTSW